MHFIKFTHFRKWATILFLITFTTTLFAGGFHSSQSEIQKKINQLCVDRYKSPDNFINFSNELLSLGVVRQTYDVLENNLNFYTKNAMVYHLPAFELEKSSTSSKFVIGSTLDLERLRKSLKNLDNKKLSIYEFHREIAKAGVVYVSVFLDKKIIYYLSQDGKHFIESY